MFCARSASALLQGPQASSVLQPCPPLECVDFGQAFYFTDTDWFFGVGPRPDQFSGYAFRLMKVHGTWGAADGFLGRQELSPGS